MVDTVCPQVPKSIEERLPANLDLSEEFPSACVVEEAL